MGGTLPDGEYNEDTKIFFCCRTDGDKKKPMALPLGTPFYLMAFNSSECQQVEGALATQEYIQFDDEDESNKDSSNGAHAYEKGKVNLTISYCYYEGERRVARGKSLTSRVSTSVRERQSHLRMRSAHLQILGFPIGSSY